MPASDVVFANADLVRSILRGRVGLQTLVCCMRINRTACWYAGPGLPMQVLCAPFGISQVEWRALRARVCDELDAPSTFAASYAVAALLYVDSRRPRASVGARRRRGPPLRVLYPRVQASAKRVRIYPRHECEEYLHRKFCHHAPYMETVALSLMSARTRH